jgi:hypothetical protein
MVWTYWERKGNGTAANPVHCTALWKGMVRRAWRGKEMKQEWKGNVWMAEIGKETEGQWRKLGKGMVWRVGI